MDLNHEDLGHILGVEGIGDLAQDLVTGLDITGDHAPVLKGDLGLDLSCHEAGVQDQGTNEGNLKIVEEVAQGLVLKVND